MTRNENSARFFVNYRPETLHRISSVPTESRDQKKKSLTLKLNTHLTLAYLVQKTNYSET